MVTPWKLKGKILKVQELHSLTVHNKNKYNHVKQKCGLEGVTESKCSVSERVCLFLV